MRRWVVSPAADFPGEVIRTGFREKSAASMQETPLHGDILGDFGVGTDKHHIIPLAFAYGGRYFTGSLSIMLIARSRIGHTREVIFAVSGGRRKYIPGIYIRGGDLFGARISDTVFGEPGNNVSIARRKMKVAGRIQGRVCSFIE